MRIAIDALGIGRPGGGRSATLNLLEPLIALDQENEYLIFLDNKETTLESPNVRQIIAPSANRIQARLWAQATWPRLLRREKADIIHHTKNLMIRFAPCPSIVTIHDLTLLEHPDIYPWTDVLYWKTIEKSAVRSADHVIAVSRLTGDDLQRFYKLPPSHITVIPEGIDESFVPIAEPQVRQVRNRLGLPERYILHVGSISAKKNLATLARAYFSTIRSGTYDGALVLVGRRYWKEGDSELDAVIEENQGTGQVIITGPVDQQDLPAVYTGAECFCFVSVHEGFGLVPLEAAACGTPVISSRVGAVEQLMGDAARYIEQPYNSVELAKHIEAIVTDPQERTNRANQCLKLAPNFSRKRAAKTTLALYKRIASRC